MADSPTDELVREHELVLLVVAAMEREVASLRRGDEVQRERVAQMMDLTRTFTDGCHHGKQEKVLFPLLEARDQAAGGPVSVMLAEHEAGRRAVRTVTEVLPRAGDDAEAREAVAENLALYAELLRLHIGKENTVLFPLAERVLGGEDKRHLAAEFERIEIEETGAGVHQRYHELAHALALDG